MSGANPSQVVLITGAAGGIGRAAVLAFARAGAQVVAADLDEAGAQQAADLARTAGAQALAVQADMASSASVQAMVAAAVARFGRLDAAFNNAGVELEGVPTHEADEDLFDRTIAINLKGVFLCMKYQLRQMLAQGGGGVIVNTASVAGLVGAQGVAGISAFWPRLD